MLEELSSSELRIFVLNNFTELRVQLKTFLTCMYELRFVFPVAVANFSLELTFTLLVLSKFLL